MLVTGNPDLFQNSHTFSGFPPTPPLYSIPDAYFLFINDDYQPIWGTYLGGSEVDRINDFSYSDGHFFIGGNSQNGVNTITEDDNITALMRYTPNENSYYLEFVNDQTFGLSLENTFLARFLFDGITPTSNVEGDDNRLISIYPNPAESEIILDLTSFKGIFDIKIYDVLGRNIKSFKSVNTFYMESRGFKIDVDQLLPGSYIIIIENGIESAGAKFIKQ